MNDRKGEWKQGWPTVASGMLGMGATAGASSITGVVMDPLVDAYGWSRSAIAANIFICSIMTLALAPAAGRLIARFGVRRFALTGVVAAVPALLLISASGPHVWSWYAAWVVFAVVNVAIGPLVWSTAVNGLFDKARGVALSLTMSGSGIAYFVLPLLAVAALGEFGWRGAYWMLAAFFLVLLLPALAAGFRGREDVGTARVGAHAHSLASSLSGYSLSAALRGGMFWHFSAICVLSAIVQGAMTIHLFPILQEGGLSMGQAASVVSLLGIALIVGRLSAGVLLDMVPGHFVFAGATALVCLAGLACIAYTGEYAMGLAIAILLGMGSGGTTNSLAFLAGRYFGLRDYAAIFGLLMGIFAISYGIAPVLAGSVRDAEGGYEGLFPLFVALAAIGVVLALLLGKPRALPEAATA